jgi:predicted protein tyrosine phosphatase
MRSRTAQEVYKSDDRFNVRSAGIDDSAPVVANSEILEWAHCIVVMEDIHLRWLDYYYPEIVARKQVVNLQIPDAYYFMEAELIDLVMVKFEELYEETGDVGE